MIRRRRLNPCLEPCLELLRLPAEPRSIERALERLSRLEPARLLTFLAQHRIGQLVHRTIVDQGLDTRLPEELAAPLKRALRQSAAAVMLQGEAGRRASEALEGAGVRYVFYKGFHFAEALYGDAVLRPAADVDLLIAEAAREAALESLLAAGFRRRPEENQPGYEVTLSGHGADVDLHTHVLQPERSRLPLTDRILSRRQRSEGLWHPDDESALVLMLLCPAITDHVTLQLIHAVDLDRWIRRASDELDWQGVAGVLSQTGLKTAAWAMLEWTRSLLQTPVPPAFERRIAPGALRRLYLREWLARDPAHLYGRRPLLVRGGFSLLLHDRPSDALRALRSTLERAEPGPVG